MSWGGHPGGGLTQLREPPQSTSFFGWVVIFSVHAMAFNRPDLFKCKNMWAEKNEDPGHFHTRPSSCILYQIISGSHTHFSHRLSYDIICYDMIYFYYIPSVIVLCTLSSNPKKNVHNVSLFRFTFRLLCPDLPLPPLHPQRWIFVTMWWRVMNHDDTKKCRLQLYLHFVDE
jgi:hypothetical protein